MKAVRTSGGSGGAAVGHGRVPPFELWFLTHAVLGAAWLGLAIYLTPAYLGSRGFAPGDIGAVMSAIGVGALTAPVVGNFADRFSAHRGLQHLGLGLLGVAAIVLMNADQLLTFVVAAFLVGVSQGVLMTVNNALITGAGWDRDTEARKFTLLQAMLAVGQGVALLVVALTRAAGGSYQLLYGVMLVVSLAGLALAVLTNRSAVERLYAAQRAAEGVAPPTVTDGDPTGGPSAAGLSDAGPVAGPAAGRGLVALLTSALGIGLIGVLVHVAGQFTLEPLYPLYMKDVFGISEAASAGMLAALTVVNLLLFIPVARGLASFGPAAVFGAMLGMRSVGYIGLAVLGLMMAGSAGYAPLAFYAILMIGYPLANVAGPMLAARLGRDMSPTTVSGLFVGALAVGASVGPALGGWASGGPRGYAILPVLGLAGAVVAMLCLALAVRRSESGR